MKILYIGDVMGEVGIETVENILPELVQSKSIDLVIAQAENVTNGKSMSLVDMKRLQDTGVHFFTGGNHTPALQEIHASLEDENVPIIGPANLNNCPGKGWKYIDTAHGRVLVISLMGSKVGAPIEADNPLAVIDEILLLNNDTDRIAVVGDHWHVPTADARVLPGGTAHITDVGMCGILNSSLGITWDSVIPRWRDNIQTRNELETTGPRQFNAVLIVSDNTNHKADSIEQIQQVI